MTTSKHQFSRAQIAHYKMMVDKEGEAALVGMGVVEPFLDELTLLMDEADAARAEIARLRADLAAAQEAVAAVAAPEAAGAFDVKALFLDPRAQAALKNFVENAPNPADMAKKAFAFLHSSLSFLGITPDPNAGAPANDRGTPVSDNGPVPAGFQPRTVAWMLACFDEATARNTPERTHRFIEEALELAQAAGVPKEDIFQLVDYVYGRPVGALPQEFGGVLVTLAALAHTFGLDLNAMGEDELARNWANKDKIRAKWLAKPKIGPLPGPSGGDKA